MPHAKCVDVHLLVPMLFTAVGRANFSQSTIKRHKQRRRMRARGHVDSR